MGNNATISLLIRAVITALIMVSLVACNASSGPDNKTPVAWATFNGFHSYTSISGDVIVGYQYNEDFTERSLIGVSVTDGKVLWKHYFDEDKGGNVKAFVTKYPYTYINH